MGDKFCPVIVSTFSSAGPGENGESWLLLGSTVCFLDQVFRRWTSCWCYILLFTTEFIDQWLDGLFEGLIFLPGIFCKYSTLILDLT